MYSSACSAPFAVHLHRFGSDAFGARESCFGYRDSSDGGGAGRNS